MRRAATLLLLASGCSALGPGIQNPFVAAQWLDLGALTSRLKQKDTASAFEAPEGTARLLVRPNGSATDMKFAVPFMEKIDQLLVDMQPETRGVSLAWLGGPYHHSVEDLKGISRDLTRTNSASRVPPKPKPNKAAGAAMPRIMKMIVPPSRPRPSVSIPVMVPAR